MTRPTMIHTTIPTMIHTTIPTMIHTTTATTTKTTKDLFIQRQDSAAPPSHILCFSHLQHAIT